MQSAEWECVVMGSDPAKWSVNKKPNPLANKTMDFALSIIKLNGKLPKNAVGEVIGRQILRSGTSVGAQYREACRARSRAEFSSKLESSLQELEETGYWLELLDRSETVAASVLEPLQQSTDEIIRIMVSSINTVKRGIPQKPGSKA
jgi:four helix bundle protein